jgi:hypothetical protein
MQKLTQEIIDQLDSSSMFASEWEDISCGYELSEDLIRQYQDKVDWHYISRFQNLSEQFIIELQDKINFQNLVQNIRLITYSEEMQRLIVENILHDVLDYKTFYYAYMTDYMRKYYEKLSIFL